MVYRNDDGVDANTLPPRPVPNQPKQGQVLCPSFFPHHSPGTRGNRPDPAPSLVQGAASLQCCALVVTRARHHGSTEAAFGAAGTRQTGAMPGSTQPLPRDRHLSAVCVTVPFSIGMDACHARSGRAMIERRLFSIAAGGTSCFGNSQPSENGQQRSPASVTKPLRSGLFCRSDRGHGFAESPPRNARDEPVSRREAQAITSIFRRSADTYRYCHSARRLPSDLTMYLPELTAFCSCLSIERPML